MSYLKEFYEDSRYEMTIPGGLHPEHSEEDLEKTSNYLKSGKMLGKVEADKYSLFLKDKKYLSIFEDKDMIGWLDFSENKLELSLNKIYILKKYRNQKFGKLLLFWLKSRFKKPIMIDGVVFKEGESLINSIENDGRFSLKIFDKKDKSSRKFSQDYQKDKDLVVMIESELREFLESANLPGVEKLISYSYFSD